MSAVQGMACETAKEERMAQFVSLSRQVEERSKKHTVAPKVLG
jgi:hypothetical protein